MNTDFLKTCDKMYASATTLSNNQEYYNSCYLSGYVIECYLKQIILKYAIKSDGTNYTVDEIKAKYAHKIHVLIRDLKDCINVNASIPASCRIDLNIMCKTICIGTGGHPKWDPRYRYGEHSAWDDKSYSDCYINEIKQLYNILSSLRVGGLI